MTAAEASALRTRLAWSLGAFIAAAVAWSFIRPAIPLPHVEAGHVVNRERQIHTLLHLGPVLAVFWYSGRAAAGLFGRWWAAALLLVVAFLGASWTWAIYAMAVIFLGLLTRHIA